MVYCANEVEFKYVKTTMRTNVNNVTVQVQERNRRGTAQFRESNITVITTGEDIPRLQADMMDSIERTYGRHGLFI